MTATTQSTGSALSRPDDAPAEDAKVALDALLDEALLESFPASDPPALAARTGVGAPKAVEPSDAPAPAETLPLKD